MWWLRPILVFSLGLNQSEQSETKNKKSWYCELHQVCQCNTWTRPYYVLNCKGLYDIQLSIQGLICFNIFNIWQLYEEIECQENSHAPTFTLLIKFVGKDILKTHLFRILSHIEKKIRCAFAQGVSGSTLGSIMILTFFWQFYF